MVVKQVKLEFDTQKMRRIHLDFTPIRINHCVERLCLDNIKYTSVYAEYK